MEFLNKDFFHSLIRNSNVGLNQSFNFSDQNFTKFDFVNSFFVDKVLSTDRANLLITTPYKESNSEFIHQVIIVASIKTLNKNKSLKPIFGLDNVLYLKTMEKASVQVIKDGKIILWKVDKKTKRVFRVIEKDLCDYILLKNYNAKNIVQLYESYLQIFEFTKDIEPKVPYSNQIKTIIVASKNNILQSIPSCIPFQYMNKNGEVYPDTPFDPLLIVVNDFKTVKEHFIEKEIPIDTIIFIGDNKYRQSISAISKGSRQEKYNHCIFIGTQNVDTGENFEVLKWNWTTPEIKFFNQSQYQNLSSETIKHPELSSVTSHFVNFISETEHRYDNLINLKKLLKFTRKVYPITAIHNEKRIRERANEIFEAFLIEAEEIFQDEYYTIDKDYKEDFEKLKILYQGIINLIKNSNPKDTWFKTASKIDFLVVPKSIKTFCEREIAKCLTSQQKGIRITNLENISVLFSQPESNIDSAYQGLKETKVISVSDFFKKEIDGKSHLFLSLYSNGIYTDILLQNILASNHKTKILCYEEEAKAMQLYLQSFQKADELELRSSHREIICGLHYPETPNINDENIDEWIKYLIGFDEQTFVRRDEIKYEIYFEEEVKPIYERSSKMIYVEGYEENFKEVREIIRGDKVRIYRPPNNELLHDLIEITDETKFFQRVNYYSNLWKLSLKEYYQTKILGYDFKSLHLELIGNGLSVDEITLKNWLYTDNKTKFPKKKRDIGAILKTVGKTGLITDFLKMMNEYYGELPKRGNQLRDEVDTFLITGEVGKMLECLGTQGIENLIIQYAPTRIIKQIKKTDEELLD